MECSANLLGKITVSKLLYSLVVDSVCDRYILSGFLGANKLFNESVNVLSGPLSLDALELSDKVLKLLEGLLRLHATLMLLLFHILSRDVRLP